MPTPNLPIKTGHAFIGLAVIMGLATLGVFNGGGKPEGKKAETKIETVDVVVPLVQINQGQTLSTSDVTLVKWPLSFLPKGGTFTQPYDVAGRVAKQTLFPGEPIFIQKLSGANASNSLKALIPKGKRAITIAVTEIKGVAGFVKPGDFVDVLTTFDISREGGNTLKKTKTILQNVLVLASAQTMTSDENYNLETPSGVTKGDALTQSTEETDKQKKEKEKAQKEKAKEPKTEEKDAKLVSSVTLALTPEQAEILALAEDSGDLRLVLRPESDNSQAELLGLDSNSLQGNVGGSFAVEPMPAPAQAPPPAPAMPAPVLGAQVEFIQGENKTLYNFNP